MSNQTENTLPAMLRPKTLIHELGISAATLYRWKEEGRIVPPVSYGYNMVAWPRSEIMEYLRLAETGRMDQESMTTLTNDLLVRRAGGVA